MVERTGNLGVSRLIRIAGVAALAALVCLLAVAQTPVAYAGGATFTVDNTTDDGTKTGCILATANDCSLRGAITRANGNSNPTEQDAIAFSIGSPGAIPTITISTELPAMTEPVSIDGGTSTALMVELAGASGNGGHGLTVASSGVTINKMVINRFDFSGVFIYDNSSGVALVENITISNNRIGLHKTANTMQGNGSPGIAIENADTQNVLITGNVIGGNKSKGIRVVGSPTGPVTIQGNFVGVTSTSVDVGNLSDGIGISNSSGVLIGGSGGSHRNHISGNTLYGIRVEDSSDIAIEGNRIGIGPNGQDVSNILDGVKVRRSDLVTMSRNVISGNGGNGVGLEDATNSSLVANTIGLNITASAPLPNSGAGVVIQSSSGITIEGNGPDRPNVISGNKLAGIDILDSSVEIYANHIGTDFDGLDAIPNGDNGITVQGSGSASIEDNVISGNEGDGVALIDSRNNDLKRNLIGVDSDGKRPLANANGVSLSVGADADIGGETLADRNVISANTGAGVALSGESAVDITSNYIGLTLDGTAANVGNGTGVSITGDSEASIGDFTESGGNYISANDGDGVVLSSGRVGISHSFIGVEGDGVTPAGNGGNGVNVTGGRADLVLQNTIANNAQNGVRIASPTLINQIRLNSIHDNGALGIDLGGDGVTENDDGDTDTGPNNLPNFPVIVFAYDDPAGDTIHWTLDTDVPNTPFFVEMFVNESCDLSEFGEGAVYVLTFSPDTDANGDIDTISSMPAGTLAVGDVVTMTATDHIAANGSTSEFSACAEVIAEPPETPTPTPDTPTPTPTPTSTGSTITPTPTLTGTVTPSATVTAAPTPTGTVVDFLTQGDFDCDGDADGDDVILLLLFAAGAPGSGDTPCELDIGAAVEGSGFAWGDVNCDGFIDGLDALFVLLFDAGLEPPAPANPCVPIGAVLT